MYVLDENYNIIDSSFMEDTENVCLDIQASILKSIEELYELDKKEHKYTTFDSVVNILLQGVINNMDKIEITPINNKGDYQHIDVEISSELLTEIETIHYNRFNNGDLKPSRIDGTINLLLCEAVKQRNLNNSKLMNRIR